MISLNAIVVTLNIIHVTLQIIVVVKQLTGHPQGSKELNKGGGLTTFRLFSC
ncbi:hypothetical protein EZJ58_3139 [Sodalis ligni]|uniref:Uncharacterized protein n=1 Tax=Sodalis ligni TaxID=2697027 RepID=A0A4R1NJQ4_9GAMM|nr:hypothetical protein EZJ58_3139 [Sodalis ligni]